MQENINRRLNKIASLMDRHVMQVVIQGVYLEALAPIDNSPLEGDSKLAYAEAQRLHTYHERQLEKLQEEKLSLTYNQKEQ